LTGGHKETAVRFRIHPQVFLADHMD